MRLFNTTLSADVMPKVGSVEEMSKLRLHGDDIADLMTISEESVALFLTGWMMRLPNHSNTKVVRQVCKWIAANPDVTPINPRAFFNTSDVADIPDGVDIRANIVDDVLHARASERLAATITPYESNSRWDLLAGLILSPLQEKPAGVAIIPRGDLLATTDGLGRIRCTFPRSLFPPGIVSRDVQLPNHRSEITSTLAPAGHITIFHMDYYGGSTLVCHISGKKLWITFPMSQHNADVMTATTKKTLFETTPEDMLDIMKKAHNVSVAIIDTKVGFVLSPFTFHAVISLTPCYHFGGPLYFPDDSIGTLKAQDVFLRSALRRFRLDEVDFKTTKEYATRFETSHKYIMQSVSDEDREAAGKHEARLKQFLDLAVTKPLRRG